MSQSSSDAESLLEQAIDRNPLMMPPDTPLTAAIATMSRTGASCILVVEQEQLTGIFTERDVVRVTVSEMPLAGVAISQVMTQELMTLCITEASDIFSVIDLLRSSGVRHLPVTDERRGCLGVVTQATLLQALGSLEACTDVELLQKKLAEKTQELRQANEQMQREAAQRQQAEEQLRQAEENWTQELKQKISDRKLLQDKLHASESKMRAVLEAMTDIILVFDAQGNIEVVPTNTSSLYEPESDIIGQTIEQFFQNENTEDWWQPIRQALDTQQTINFDYSLTIGGDRELWFSACISPMLNNSAIWVARDISDRQQAESALRLKNQELANTLQELKLTQQELIQSEKMAALGQLIAGIAHEVNTPLGAIRSSVGNIADFLAKNLSHLPEFFQQLSPERYSDFLALLEKATQQITPLSSKEKRQFRRVLVRQLELRDIARADTIADTLVDLGVYGEIESLLPLLHDPDSLKILNTLYQLASLQRSTATIMTATDRAAKVVYALRNYARYDQSGEKVQANLIEGIETVLTLYHNQMKQGVEVIRNYDTGLTPMLCYPDELNQVWTNLIHNAVQAMEMRGTLRIDVKEQDGSVRVSITDTGQGIPPKIIPRIFEPFFTTKPPGEGSGLGLNIVKKIVEKHQGKIDVESRPGKTTFTVSLPIYLN